MKNGLGILGWALFLLSDVCAPVSGNLRQDNSRINNLNTGSVNNIGRNSYEASNLNPRPRSIQNKNNWNQNLNTGPVNLAQKYGPEYLNEGSTNVRQVNSQAYNGQVEPTRAGQENGNGATRLQNYASYNSAAGPRYYRKQNTDTESRNTEFQSSGLQYSDDKYNEVQVENPERYEEQEIPAADNTEFSTAARNFRPAQNPEPAEYPEPAEEPYDEPEPVEKIQTQQFRAEYPQPPASEFTQVAQDTDVTQEPIDGEGTSQLPDLTRNTRQDSPTPDPYDGSFETGPADHKSDMGELPGGAEEMEESAPTLSFVEWCEGDVRKRVLQSQCQEITFVPPFPTCYCIDGMASVRLDQTKNCETSFHFASAGCYNFEALGHGARSIRLEGNFRKSDMVIAVEIKTELKSEWSILGNDDIQDGTLVQIQRNIRLLNGELFQADDGTNCIQKLNSKIVRTYRNVYGTYNVSFDRCPGFAISDSRLVFESPVVDKDFELCTPTCKKYCGDKAKENENTSKESNPDEPNEARSNAAVQDENTLPLPSIEPFCKPIPSMLKSLHDDLNTRILRRSIDRSFHANAEIVANPEKSFNILAKLAEITHKVCKNGDVPMRFLDTAVDVLKVAHEGRGFYFHEDFAPRDYKFIMKALDSCFNEVETLEFHKTDCDGIITDVQNGTHRTPLKLSADHQYFDHHVVLDVSWNLMDLINVACVDSFKHSYRMYHELEQGIEKLFTRELRTFWQYPDFPRNFYERIFGQFWRQLATNLEFCVEGSYVASNKKMWRLNRPTWLEGVGSGTKGDKICKRRLTNEVEKLLSRSSEIYCLPLKCS